MVAISQSMQINELGHNIYLLDTGYIRPGLAACYLLVQDRQIAVIETGTAHTVPLILDAIHQLGFKATDVAYIIPTHVHLDHAGGAGLLMQQCPQAQLVIHPRGARHLIDPEKLTKGTIAVYGEQRFRTLYGELVPVAAGRIIEAADNDTLKLNDRVLTFYDTPGHARHHFCVYDALSQGIFSGDTFGLCYRELDTRQGPFLFATTTPVQFDPDALLHSIDRLLSLKPAAFYLTHYGRIEPTSAMIEQLKDSILTFSNIAAEEQQPVENRSQRIAEKLMNYLLDALQEMKCFASRDDCCELLTMDVQLNAQGLDVWLNRRNANSA